MLDFRLKQLWHAYQLVLHLSFANVMWMILPHAIPVLADKQHVVYTKYQSSPGNPSTAQPRPPLTQVRGEKPCASQISGHARLGQESIAVQYCWGIKNLQYDGPIFLR